MFSNDSLVEKMKSFDVYRKLPKNYLQPTFVGAVCKLTLNFDSVGHFGNSHGNVVHERVICLFASQDFLRNVGGSQQEFRNA